MKEIVILSTGGTISTKFSAEAGGLVPALGAEDLLLDSHKARVQETGINLKLKDIAKLNSSSLSVSLLLDIVGEVRRCMEDPDVAGVVITHGTGMMEETGYLMDISVDAKKPIVMTGAQRDYAQPDSDGPRNLLESILVAAEPATAEQGVVIVFNSEIYPARDVTKQDSLAIQAFSSGKRGYLGCVYPDGVIYYRKNIRPAAIHYNNLQENVDLIKFAVGSDARYIDASIAHNARGIVIEGSGNGNVNRPFYDGIKKAIDNGIMVGIAKKTPEGRTFPIYANVGGGASLVEAGALLLGDLSGQKGRLLFMAALGDNRSVDEARGICERHIM